MANNYVVGIELQAKGNARQEIGEAAKATDALDDAFGRASGGAGGLGGALSGLVSPSYLAAGALAGVGAAAIATGAQAVQLAGEVEGSTAKMTTQLGLSKDQAVEFEDTMRSIYRNNYGESFDDIGQSLSEVEQNFRRIGGTESQQELQQVTELAFGLRDAFDIGVSESTNAAVTLMEEFGLSAEQAFDFIVAGNQRGLNASGDFLDTIGEYSTQFGNAGADADEFFSILESGLQGGVLGTDKIADAFKEFNIRVMDDSDSTREALADIGIDYDELTQGIADGSITQMDAMQDVIERIREIENPIERNRIGVALFGTQWEDLTEDVILGVDTQKTKLGELEGAADSLADQYDTDAARWESATRLWNDALVDVGKELRSLGAESIPWVVEQIETKLIPAVQYVTQLIANTRSGEGIGLNPINNWRQVIDEMTGNGGGSNDLAVVNPVNTAPSGPPPGWVGAWTPQMGSAQGVTVQQNFYGRTDPDEVGRATSDAVGTNYLDVMRSRGER